MKEDDKPMERPTREPLPLRQAPRCLARTRAGTPCQKAAATGKKRCRMHGALAPFARAAGLLAELSVKNALARA